MSTVRRQRWTSTSRRPLGCGAPPKYGTSGWLPAVVNSTELSLGMQGAAGDLGVTAADEEVDVGTPKLVGREHVDSL